MSLSEAVERARKKFHFERGKCSMCAIGDEPVNGLHHGKYKCGNEDTCTLCHNAGMEHNEQCAACGRIEKT